jgi:hypothetical protein
MAWTRKKLRRKARKAAKAQRPLSFDLSDKTAAMLDARRRRAGRASRRGLVAHMKPPRGSS